MLNVYGFWRIEWSCYSCTLVEVDILLFDALNRFAVHLLQAYSRLYNKFTTNRTNGVAVWCWYWRYMQTCRTIICRITTRRRCAVVLVLWSSQTQLRLSLRPSHRPSTSADLRDLRSVDFECRSMTLNLSRWPGVHVSVFEFIPMTFNLSQWPRVHVSHLEFRTSDVTRVVSWGNFRKFPPISKFPENLQP